MEFLVTLLHVGVCLALIIIILLQAGKGAGMGAAFGGSSQTVFGSTGRATFLTKVTIAAAVIFGLTSLGLSFMGGGEEDLMKDYKGEKGSAASELPIPAPSTGGEPSAEPAASGKPGEGSDIEVPDVNKPRTPEKAEPGGEETSAEESEGAGEETEPTPALETAPPVQPESTETEQ
ncbi:MAG: preprotein translocase subunit SecG [bacterium]